MTIAENRMPGQDLEDLCEGLLAQFPTKLLDLRVHAQGSDVGCFRPDGALTAHALHDAPAYDIGCIQTLFEGFAVAHLCKDGLINPDAFVGEYLPELCFSGVHPPGRRIRVRDLLTHSTGHHAPSGLASQAGFACWNDVVAYFGQSPEAFPPGTVCSWNGLGRSLLIPLVERVAGARMHEIVRASVCGRSGVTAEVRNEDSGWPSISLTLTEIVRIIEAMLGDGSAGTGLLPLLEADAVRVVRRAVSSRSGNPVAYSWGMALFADDLWGQVGNGRSHTMGIRFDTTLSFFTALSIGAAPFARDLVLQYVSAANGYSRAPGPAHALGSIVGCNLGQIAGRYHGDVGDCIEVSLAKDLLECKISRKNEFVANVPMRVAEDGLLIGDGRWDAFQFEFFPHPETGEACLMLGQIAYKKF